MTYRTQNGNPTIVLTNHKRTQAGLVTASRHAACQYHDLANISLKIVDFSFVSLARQYIHTSVDHVNGKLLLCLSVRGEHISVGLPALLKCFQHADSVVDRICWHGTRSQCSTTLYSRRRIVRLSRMLPRQCWKTYAEISFKPRLQHSDHRDMYELVRHEQV